MDSYLQKINYSFINEDSSSEIETLKLSSEDNVLCITGSGARVLDLLIQKPKKILAIDFNPCQNFLLELKMAAVKNLEYERFISFIGLYPSDNRLNIFQQITSSLSTQARNYWERNIDLILKGVIYQGSWEKYFRNLSDILNILRPELVKKLFLCKSIEEQILFWKNDWDDLFWKWFIKIISARITWKYLFRDPGFYKYVPQNFSIENYIRQRFASASENFLFNESPFFHLLFKSRIDLNVPLPPHLQKEYYSVLKENLCKVQILTGSLTDLYHCAKNTFFDAYSLSDFSSYVNQLEYRNIWKAILNKSSDNARVCERQFLVKREIPPDNSHYLERDFPLEKKLEKSDNSIFYSFIIASIAKKKYA